MVSVDTIEDNTKFAQMHEADYPILSDVTKEIATKYGVLGPSGLARRWTFYIGPDGKILHIDNAVKPASAGPDMVAEMGELKFDNRNWRPTDRGTRIEERRSKRCVSLDSDSIPIERRVVEHAPRRVRSNTHDCPAIVRGSHRDLPSTIIPPQRPRAGRRTVNAQRQRRAS